MVEVVVAVVSAAAAVVAGVAVGVVEVVGDRSAVAEAFLFEQPTVPDEKLAAHSLHQAYIRHAIS